jgi:hypothetical protein
MVLRARIALPLPSLSQCEQHEDEPSNSVAAKGLLRHSSVSTTERHYIKDVPESTLEAMKLLETLCNPSATDTGVKPS